MTFSPQFPRLFLWHVARYARRHPLLAALNILSVALGVAVYLAIGIANHSANESFAGSVDLVAGKANLEVRAPGGGFDENLLPRLAAALGVRAATPLVEGYVTLPDFPGEYLQILGVDLFTQAPFATFTLGDERAGRIDFEPWLAGPDALALSEEFAREHDLKIGDRLRVQVNGRDQTLTVRFLLRLDASVAGRGNSRVGALDIGWAQEFLSRRGQLSGIQLLLDRPAEAERVAAELRKLVPADVNVAAPGQRSGQIQRMLGSFELNLGALSLISLLVGMFLIYNTIAASVVRRRTEVGILRAVGASRAEVQALFLGEAALFGVGGVFLGLVGGVLLARFLLGREIARVVSTLYALVSIDRYYLTPWLVGSAVFFGLGSVLAAAWLPAREGARIDPVAALSLGGGATREGSRLRRGRWLLAGLGALGLAGMCSALALFTGPASLGFGAAFFVLLGFALTAPMVTTAGAELFGRLFVHHGETEGMGAKKKAGPETSFAFLRVLRFPVVIIPRLATQNLVRSLHRTAVIVAALMAAIAMTVGISVMIHAFRQTVNTWINRALQADLFLTPSANETIAGGSPAFFPPEVLSQLRTFPGVEAVDTVREFGVPVQGERISMAVVAGDNRGKLAFLGGGEREKQRAFYEPDRIFCSEPFARRFRVREGDRLPLPTPDGVVNFTVAGIYYDYSRDSGVLAIARENFLRRWHDDRVMSVALYLRNPAEIETVAAALRTRFNQRGEFLIYSNRAIRERVFEIFEQTFRVTGVLRGIAVVVAVIGIFLTLTTLVAEREREIGVLRAVGASRGQIQGTVLTESALIGVLSSVLGLVAGLALAVVLTFVINKAFFGWTIQFAVPWGTVLATPLWIVPAALLAGWGPAVRAGRVPIAAAVRAE